MLFSQSEYSNAYHLLSKALKSATALGGSNAQRDIVEMTAITGAIKSGLKTEAKNLIQISRSLRHDSPLKNYFLEQITNPELVQ